MVPEEGLEPSCLATNDFESFAYTIPPLRQAFIILHFCWFLKYSALMKKILVIVGPTASGKSSLGIQLAKKYNGEIISADSRQVYRGLNIGTGKVTKKEMAGIPHHLLDVISPKKVFNADEYVTHAQKAIEDICSRGKLAIVVGGTGFYIDALMGRIALAEVAPNPALRTRLAKKNPEHLYALLEKKDPERAKAMSTASERNNKVRLIRALEVACAGKTHQRTLPSQGNSEVRLHYDALWIGIAPLLTNLDKKISLRLKARLRVGMIAEAKRLHAEGLSYKRMKELGLEYRSLAGYLQGEITRHDLVEELEIAIRQYARRQITYWKRNPDIEWFAPGASQKINLLIRNWQRQ